MRTPRGLAVGLAVLAAVVARACIVVPPEPPFPRPPRPAPGPIYLQCRSQHVTISIEHPVARVKVETTLLNPHPGPVEGTFVFPIPPGASVTKFQFTVDGKQVTGEILPAEKARDVFVSFVRRTLDPALLEYSDFALFKASIFPVPPGATRDISLEYLVTLKPEADLVRLFHNLKLGRGRGEESGRLVIEGRIHSGLALTTVFSPSHELDVKREGAHEARFSLELSERPYDRDFVLCYGVAQGELGMHWLANKAPGEDGYFLLALAPTVPDDKAPPPKDVVLVLDTSGSMRGQKVEQARRALDYALGTLGKEDRFALVSFATAVRELDEKLLPATGENVQRARKFVADLEAVGGTALNDALVAACGMFEGAGDRPRYVLLATDGLPTVGERDEGRILKNVTAARDEAGARPPRLFLMGVGYDVNTRLLDTLAGAGGGATGYVRPEEDLEVALSALVSKIGHPVLTDARLSVTGTRVADVLPSQVPDLFRGDQVLAVGRYMEGGGVEVKLTGRLEGAGEKSWKWPVQLPGKEMENDFLPRLWATRQVGYLLDQMRLHGEEEELKKEVVRLALKFGIVTPYTSYLVLEEEPRLALDAGRRPGWAAATAPPGAGGRGGGGGAFGAEPARAREAREAMMGPGMGAGAVGAAVDLGAMKQAGAAPMAGARGGASAAAAQSVRALGGKVFYLDPETGFWVDSEYKGEGREVKMKYLGRAYLALVAQRPDIARFLAVGEKAKLQVGEVGLVVSPDFDDADEGQVNELLR